MIYRQYEPLTLKRVETALRRFETMQAAAEALGVPRTTLRDWCKNNMAQPEPEIEAATEIPADLRKITGLQDENARLRAMLKEAHRASLDDDAIAQIIGGIVGEAASPPDWTIDTSKKNGRYPEVPVTIWSDWHAGEVVSITETNGVNEFNRDILERRVHRLVERTIDLLRNHGPGNYPGIVVGLLGDMVSGGLHPELVKTDDEEVIPSVLTVRDLLIWAFDRLLEEFKEIYVPCTAGNHGRQTPKPEFKRYVYKSFDWLIYQLVARHYAGNPRIVFDIPDANEVFFKVFGRRYLAMHGDMMGVKGGDGIIGSLGPIVRGELKVGRQSSVIGRDYDTLIIGHWHQTLFLPRVHVNNTLKGFDEFAKNALRAPPSTPSQSLWLEHPKWGKTMQREVYLEDPNAEMEAPWVSVFGAEK
jgi:hypothetical protein